ncbi:MAG: radical SAM protein [Patescibacteria group bacterium]
MSKIFFDFANHEFSADNSSLDYAKVSGPLSVIVQVTRRCNLACESCSESEIYQEPSQEDLETLKIKLTGTPRIYLSGGEPLVRKDIFEVIEMYHGAFQVLGLPTNSILMTPDVCKKLKGKVHYVNAGLDGPRLINDQVRGNFDGIIQGLLALRDADIEVSLSTVLLQKTLPHLSYVIQIADILNIVKVKMVIPILRGRAKSLIGDDFASSADIMAKFVELKQLKERLGWKPRIKFTFWEKNTEGYAIIVYPDQRVHAWPVFDQPECVLYLGDLRTESMTDIWARYPYKHNHINKYVGISMNKA